MAVDYSFTEADMQVDEALGYPKAYAKLCRDREIGPYSHGPPFTFNPYALQQDEALEMRELNQMFPVIDSTMKSTSKTKIFVNLLWKQLNHLGNAGFDPAVIRLDPYGNVLYFHADSASPLAWDVDHWFPCSRGGRTVPSNLRILQKQVCKKKHNKLEFLVPWWDLQLGISANQFLSIFSSSNSDFRHRGFSFLFSQGENEELNDSQTVDSHAFPHHFIESKDYLGLAPAAIVLARAKHYDSPKALKPLDYNRQMKPQSPSFALRKSRGGMLKENDDPDFITNPYQAIVKARDSLRQTEERTQKMEGEIQKFDDEVNDLTAKNEEEKLTIEELELNLIKRRRRAEKCRRLAEAQSSYRTMLEKMIRDAMHQSVVYKEQLRLNTAASNTLMARLEAQKAISDAAERELHKKFKERDELENKVRPQKYRKRLRADDTTSEEDNKSILYLPGILRHKELRAFLDDELKLSENGLSNEPLLEKMTKLKIRSPAVDEPNIEEDEEGRKQRGKGNVEKWLEMLLENSTQEKSVTDEVAVPSSVNKEEEKKQEQEITEVVEDKNGKTDTKFVRSESARVLRRIPSSPSLIIKSSFKTMKKAVNI